MSGGWQGGVSNGVLTFHQGDGRVAELLPSGFGSGDGSELGGVGPTPDGEECFHMPVLLFQQVQLLDATVRVLPLVVP